eukprot:m.77635 g.77635  ORF g.77635 m.77635 type:complete len:222 (-) comp14073_c0_seq1:564-1229(-)
MGKSSNANEKAQVAKARKQYQQALKDAQRKQAEEDAKWVDGDPRRKKLEQRRLEKNAKSEAVLQRKAENKALLAEEEEIVSQSMHKAKGKDKPNNLKKTRAQLELMKLEREKEARQQAKEAEMARQRLSVQHVEEENPNLVMTHLVEEHKIHEARSVEEAIEALRVAGPSILPKRRMTYEEFEQENLEAFKADNPGLRLSQVKVAVRKAWQRSPSNPLNQA